MKYELIKSSKNDITKLIEYKKINIFDYATNLTDEDKIEINNYVSNNIPKLLNDYKSIIINEKVIGCVLFTKIDEGLLLDEIYIEEEYRNNGIGTDIIKNVINKNDDVYLWVYKQNIKAISLYKRLDFKIIDETNFRYYMLHKKG